MQTGAGRSFLLAIVGSTVETDDPVKELQMALAMLGPIQKQFLHVMDTYESTGDFTDKGVFITKSYDATSHFGNATNEVVKLYEQITGNPPDLTGKDNNNDNNNNNNENEN